MLEDTKPCIVDVKIETKWSFRTFRHFYFSGELLGKTGWPTCITQNILKSNRAVPNFFTVFYLPDELLPEESDWNECVNIISGGEEAEDWNGPILIVKSQGFVCILIFEK